MGDILKKIIYLLLITICLLPVNAWAEEDVSLAEKATSAIIIEASTGEIIFEKNSHEKLAPASMTKIMTMLIIMENIENGNLKWSDEVTASAYASSMGGSQIFLEAGETMTVEELLKGIAIASGNDAAVAMAEKIAVTEDEFVKLMNKKAVELGIKNTNFKNVTGLTAENHYSTANDMAYMAKELVKYDKVLEFTGTYEDYLRTNSEKKFWLVNTNKLVRFYSGVDGLKTGFTTEAGYCLTATAKKENMRLITVVMKEPDSSTRNSETTSMLDYAFNKYKINTILSKKDVIKKSNIVLGTQEKINVVPSNDVNVLVNKTDNKKEITYETDIYNIEAPIKKGDIVGKLKLFENGKKINTVYLTVEKDVAKANIFKIYMRNLKNIISGSI